MDPWTGGMEVGWGVEDKWAVGGGIVIVYDDNPGLMEPTLGQSWVCEVRSSLGLMEKPSTHYTLEGSDWVEATAFGRSLLF
ncbi:hypothetical protein SLA2020_162070 [Shorea laevis]